MIANNPIVKALKEYKGSNKQSHLDEKHWQKTGTFSRLHYSCMKTVLEVVHHAQLTAENFNSIPPIYFIYYWQVIHTNDYWTHNLTQHLTLTREEVPFEQELISRHQIPPLYVISLWLFKDFPLFNRWWSGCFLNQSLHFCAIFGTLKRKEQFFFGLRTIFFWSHESICHYHLSSPYKLVVDKDFEVFWCMLFF